MRNKTIVQFFLLTLLILISFFILNFYLKKNIEVNQTNKQSTNVNTNENINNKGNIIENIKYISSNTKGDIYEIFADYSEASIENPDLMFLKNVKANIKLKNKEIIFLTSEYANFNSKTFETTFINDVKITRTNETITGNELYLVLDSNEESGQIKGNQSKKEENILRMSHNILVQRPGSTLKADVIEIDLITKNLKIYMLNKNNKVKVKTKLN
tara:strand:+ start:466 stop:1107 length:642 start_codon:yes stop_codon:yes gene_type:complete